MHAGSMVHEKVLEFVLSLYVFLVCIKLELINTSSYVCGDWRHYDNPIDCLLRLVIHIDS